MEITQITAALSRFEGMALNEALKDPELAENFAQSKSGLEQEYWEKRDQLAKKKQEKISALVTDGGLGAELAGKTATDALRPELENLNNTYQEKYLALCKKYNVPPEGFSPFKTTHMDDLSELSLGRWLETLKEYFSRYYNEVLQKLEYLKANPAMQQVEINKTEQKLQAREREGAFIEEGFVSKTLSVLSYPFRMLWKGYTYFLETRLGWLRDRWWNDKVKKVDSNADPEYFVFHMGTPEEMSKADYSAKFFAQATIVFLSIIASLVTIPIVRTVILGLFELAKEQLIETIGDWM